MPLTLQEPIAKHRAARRPARPPRRVLFLSYAFPPVGGAGVQRVVKFAKYLPQFGWQASVLTVRNPSVPVLDRSLADDLPPNLVVRRARSMEPGYAFKAAVSAGALQAGRGSWTVGLKHALRRWAVRLLQPDPQILWLPAAWWEGRRLLRELRHDAIIATAPPFSSFLLGAALSRASGLPLLLDYRDEWGLSNSVWENKQAGRWENAVQQHCQRWAARTAAALLATTRSSAESIAATCAGLGVPRPTTWIYNGFDRDDFPEQVESVATEQTHYRLAYVGTLWNLVSAEPLVGAVEELCRRAPDRARRLELVFAGRHTASQEALLDRLAGLPCKVTRYGYLDHTRALDVLRSADRLCVLLSDVPGAGRCVPAKVFEYLASGRPILGILPPGEARELLARFPQAALYHPQDRQGIVTCLKRDLADGMRDAGFGMRDAEYQPGIAAFERRHQAGQLAALLEQITDPA